jgi:hypothetical protein
MSKARPRSRTPAAAAEARPPVAWRACLPEASHPPRHVNDETSSLRRLQTSHGGPGQAATAGPAAGSVRLAPTAGARGRGRVAIRTRHSWLLGGLCG